MKVATRVLKLLSFLNSSIIYFEVVGKLFSKLNIDSANFKSTIYFLATTSIRDRYEVPEDESLQFPMEDKSKLIYFVDTIPKEMRTNA